MSSNSITSSSSARTFGTIAAVATGTAYLVYRSIPMLMTAVIKLTANPPDEELGQVIAEKCTSSYEEITALGILKGKSALVVGGTRGVGYGTALALAKSGAAVVTVVGRSAASGEKAVSKIRKELQMPSSSPSHCSTNIMFLQGDIGTVASTQRLLYELGEGKTRYDYLIVTAAIFPQPMNRNPQPLNSDGVEKSFAIGVVGRFLLYRKAYTFMKKRGDDCFHYHSPMILNVCASGSSLPVRFNRELVRSLARNHLQNIANFAIGNELMLHKLVENDGGDHSSCNCHNNCIEFNIPVITTHPGFLKTDLHREQGLLMDMLEAIAVHFVGCTEGVCGRRKVSLLCAMGSKQQQQKGNNRDGSSMSLLTIVDNFGHGRLINSRMDQDLKDHGDWLWNLLLAMEADGIFAGNLGK